MSGGGELWGAVEFESKEALRRKATSSAGVGSFRIDLSTRVKVLLSMSWCSFHSFGSCRGARLSSRRRDTRRN